MRNKCARQQMHSVCRSLASPNTVWLPSSQLVVTVQMKNLHRQAQGGQRPLAKPLGHRVKGRFALAAVGVWPCIRHAEDARPGVLYCAARH